MKAQVEQMQRDEERIVREKQAKAKQMLLDVETSNKLTMSLREQRKQQEKEEDMAIMRYVQQRQQREFEQQEAERRQKEEKEREVQKLREMQEKAADRQGEIDALRAKRAFEQQERHARQVEKLNMEKRQRLLSDLEQARARQFKEKEDHLARQAEFERSEFLRIVQAQKSTEEKEKMINDQKRRAFMAHKEDLSL